MGTARSNTKRTLTNTLTRREVSPEGGHWSDEAACRTVESKIFYYESAADYTSLLHAAETFCNACPVAKQCLVESSSEDRYWTVRGGMLPRAASGYTIGRPKKTLCDRGHNNWGEKAPRVGANGRVRVSRFCKTCRDESVARRLAEQAAKADKGKEAEKKRLLDSVKGKKCAWGHAEWTVRSRHGALSLRCLACMRKWDQKYRAAKMRA